MAEKLLLPFALLADTEAAAIHAYGVWEEKRGCARPAIFVIDVTGVIRYAYVGEDFADRPLDADVLAALAGGGGA